MELCPISLDDKGGNTREGCYPMISPITRGSVSPIFFAGRRDEIIILIGKKRSVFESCVFSNLKILGEDTLYVLEQRHSLDRIITRH